MSDKIDILYVTWNRKVFTDFSTGQLVENTDWSRVNRLVVWDDYSQDGTLELLRSRIEKGFFPVPVDLRVGGYRSCVAIMNRYIEAYDASIFAKIDNDIVVPPGWLTDMLAVMDAEPELDLLGMQAAFTRTPGPEPTAAGSGPHTYEPADHIGGVGLMRRAAFERYGPIKANGRYGFTHWQETNEPQVGWIVPDLRVTCLDQIPFDPWRLLSMEYTRMGWQRPRPWEPYEDDHDGWSWWPPGAKEKAA